MNPALKYALARIVLFVVCLVPAMLFLPAGMNPLLKIMVALVVSAVLSFVLLKGLRNDVAERMAVNARERAERRERLRSTLAGDDHEDSRDR